MTLRVVPEGLTAASAAVAALTARMAAAQAAAAPVVGAIPSPRGGEGQGEGAGAIHSAASRTPNSSGNRRSADITG